MNKNYLLLFFVFISLQLSAQVINIPDINFKNRLLNHNPVIDTNGNGEIEVSEAQVVEYLAIGSSGINDLTGLEAFTNLEGLYAGFNSITSFDYPTLVNLNILSLSFNNLTILDVSQNVNLVDLSCSNNDLITLNVLQNTSLETLECTWNQLTTLDISQNTSLQTLDCYSNELTALDVSQNINLVNLGFGVNQLTMVDVSQNINLENLYCASNPLTTLDVSQNINLVSLDCSDTNLNTLDVSQNTSLQTLDCYSNELTALDVSQNINLVNLNCSFNDLATLDVSQNTGLETISCLGNYFTNLNFSQNNNLIDLTCGNNDLTSLDISQNILLEELDIRSCQFDIDISNNVNLKLFDSEENNFSSLDLSQNTNLERFVSTRDNLPSVDLSGNPNLFLVHIWESQLTTLDLSQNPNILQLRIEGNYYLENVNFKNGNNVNVPNYTFLRFIDSPNLQTICVDDVGYAETNFVKDPQAIFVEDCSITDVNYNLISGVVTFDEDNNGCDNTLDPNIPNVLITANDGTNEYGTFTNSNGGYVIDVPTGTYTTEVNGLFEQYTVDPVSGSSSFVNLGETDTQDFCFTANQVFYDVEAVLLPLTVARPGFDATYQLVYKNNGLSITNGSITFEFNDMQQTFVSSSQVPDVNNVNSLSFNYSNLQPFETRTIDITLNTFSPPTVNGDDILNLTVSIQPTDSDIIPENNVYNLEQIVVNSYDPNDKQVLQGAEITMEQANEYLDYLIRFQNTGTASAINVAITDELSNDLDWSTIQPLSSSHDYYARITNGNFVEFIFDNINLPAEQDDAEGSNGFVAFRIKPKSDVVVGDVITGLANIYFDFNAPIITNTVSTEIVEPLSLNDYSIENQITLYPNPTSGLLNLNFREDIVLSSVIITNISGSKVLEIKEPVDNIDLSEYPSGVYFIKFSTDKGAINKRIVKN